MLKYNLTLFHYIIEYLFTHFWQRSTTIHYSSCGIVCHKGSLVTGHYVSYVKDNDTWINQNDCKVNFIYKSQ